MGDIIFLHISSLQYKWQKWNTDTGQWVLTKCLLGSHIKFAWMYVKDADAVSTPTNDVDDTPAIFLCYLKQELP